MSGGDRGGVDECGGTGKGWMSVGRIGEGWTSVGGTGEWWTSVGGTGEEWTSWGGGQGRGGERVVHDQQQNQETGLQHNGIIVHNVLLVYLADEFIGNSLRTNLISSEGTLEKQTQGELWLHLCECHDGLQTELEDTLALLQPAVILRYEGRRIH